MERTQIYLTEEERRALKSLAARLGRSQSALIRDAIDRYVDRYQEGNRLDLLRQARGLWADALIATSATARGAELLTFNRRHYPMFEGVRVPYRR
jgi:predicted nucleic acid-binding protein